MGEERDIRRIESEDAEHSRAPRAFARRKARAVKYVPIERTRRTKVFVGEGPVDQLGKRTDAVIQTVTFKRSTTR